MEETVSGSVDLLPAVNGEFTAHSIPMRREQFPPLTVTLVYDVWTG